MVCLAGRVSECWFHAVSLNSRYLRGSALSFLPPFAVDGLQRGTQYEIIQEVSAGVGWLLRQILGLVSLAGAFPERFLDRHI